MGKSDPRDWHQSGVNCWHSTIVCAACGFHSESLSQTSEGPCRRRCGRPVRDYFRSISEVECEGARLDRTASGGPTAFPRLPPGLEFLIAPVAAAAAAWGLLP